METVNTTERLKHLRSLMKENKVDIYIVPSEDSHQSEYVAACDARRGLIDTSKWLRYLLTIVAHISGFSGSAGTAVVTADKAALATDGRYFNQASQQLDNNWELLKQGIDDVPTWQEWTAEQSEGNRTVGVDPTVITAPEARSLLEKIKKKGGAALSAVTSNLVDVVWGSDRPPAPKGEVKPLDIKFAGQSSEDKLEALRKELEKKKGAGLIICMPRVFISATAPKTNPFRIQRRLTRSLGCSIFVAMTTLYVDRSKLSRDVEQHLGDKVQIKPYNAIFEDTKAMAESLEAETDGSNTPKRKFMISTKASWALSLNLGGEEKVEEIRSPVGDAKVIKNKTELDGMRACHVRDGAALCRYFAWLEEELLVKGTKLDEVNGADKLESIRSEGEHFVGLSFDTISSTGANAAVIHYKPEPGLCSSIDPAAIYLCDSGAQYLDGTTDTTRTMHFGTPTQLERKAYTLVLKGVIALDTAVFPKGTSGFQIDSFARQFLWREGLDYRHGTGHGVGSYLNVHEGPIGIGTRIAFSEVPLSAGNVLSDEPGYYEDGSFGIRIENMIIAKEVETAHRFGDKPYFGFEHVTMVPYCRKLIDAALLTDAEREWVNSYHREIVQKTKAFFEGDERTLKWLQRETKAI
ncbi:MAG: hypothetical protein Q9191_002690 [Dirinaria sp. TL-2023a]